MMVSVFVFIFGTIIGSFLNVLALRYDPDRFLFTSSVVGGRSRCLRCRKTLSARELVPLLSFVVQRGRCRHCSAKISLQYPIVEILCGLIFVFVPRAVCGPFVNSELCLAESAIWISAGITLLLITLIDIRLRIIPDEASVFLAALGAVRIFFLSAPALNVTDGKIHSFVGAYTLLLGVVEPLWLNHVVGALLGALFFSVLIIITRGRGMGVGDLKLAAALGALFGWPDIVLIILLAFVIGAVVGIELMAASQKTMKGFLPFGPFLAIGAALVFFAGFEILHTYFSFFDIPV